MAEKSKFTTILATMAIIILIALCILCSLPELALAEDNNSSVILSADSLFDTYSDNLVYSKESSLYLITPTASFCFENAFNKPLLSLTVTNKNIYAICGDTDNANVVLSFDYNSSTISNKRELSFTNISNQADIFMVTRSGDAVYLMSPSAVYKLNTSDPLEISYVVNSNILAETKDFCVQNQVLYVLKDNNLYSIATINGADTLGDPILTSVAAMSYYDNTVAVVKDSQIQYKTVENAWRTMSSPTAMEFKQLQIFGNTLYGMTDTAIKKYIILSDHSLEFNRIYDNEIYVNPSEYTILQFAYSNECKLYVSPKNLEVKAQLSKNTKVLVLNETDNYYYVYYNNLFGFIGKDNLTLMQSNATTTLGQFAQPLHDSTVIYKYPYSTSPQLQTIEVTDIVTVIDNVAERNGIMESDYYYVSYTNANGDLVKGYVLATYLASYTDYKAPTARKTAKVQVDAVGTTAKAYLLPDETSSILYSLSDGDEVGLLEDFNSSSEWTKVLINNQTCYIKTSNLVYKALTKMQITLIIICSLLAVSTIVTICVLHARKAILKKQSIN